MAWVIIAMGILIFAILAMALVDESAPGVDYTVGFFVLFMSLLVLVIWVG